MSDQNYIQIKRKIDEFATSKLHKKSAGCAAIVLMSHGDTGNRIMTECGKPLPLNLVVSLFADEEAYPNLKGKLKLLIVNACR